MSHSLWVEKYRPTDLSTYIGNEHLREKVGVYLESGDVPHLLLYGRAGTGKTFYFSSYGIYTSFITSINI